MKELSIKEKAKAYDETIEKLRNFYKDYDNVSRLIDVKEELANLIPELKESEDERIRKELIEQVVYIVPNKNEVDDNGNTLPCYTTRINKYIAWLEKQGEYKSTEWSKDDEQYLRVCKNALRKYQSTDNWDSYIISQWLDNKLKSIRFQWKPSEQQINALGDVLSLREIKYDVLSELLDCLKKLK